MQPGLQLQGGACAAWSSSFCVRMASQHRLASMCQTLYPYMVLWFVHVYAAYTYSAVDLCGMHLSMCVPPTRPLTTHWLCVNALHTAGEKAVLAAAKVAALQLLFAAEDSDEEEDGDEDEEEDVDSELDEAEAAALAAAMAAAAEAAAGGGRAHSKRQRAAPAAAGAGAGSRGKKQKHGLGYTGQDDAKAAGGEEAEEAAAGTGRHKHHHHHRRHKHKKDHRAHFGAMTGPSEEDVWQSDDSEKVSWQGFVPCRLGQLHASSMALGACPACDVLLLFSMLCHPHPAVGRHRQPPTAFWQTRSSQTNPASAIMMAVA